MSILIIILSLYWLVSGIVIIRDIRKSILFTGSLWMQVLAFIFAPILLPWIALTWAFEKVDQKLGNTKPGDLDVLGEHHHAFVAGAIIIYLIGTSVPAFLPKSEPQVCRCETVKTAMRGN